MGQLVDEVNDQTVTRRRSGVFLLYRNNGQGAIATGAQLHQQYSKPRHNEYGNNAGEPV